jgi:serine/threonine-protein kinase
MTPIDPTLSAALADRYRLERELGTGGTATVDLAEDLKHSRKVAVKATIPEATLAGPEADARDLTPAGVLAMVEA